MTISRGFVPLLSGRDQPSVTIGIVVGVLATVEVDPRELGARGRLSAELGASSAECVVIVNDRQGGPDLNIRLADEEGGNFRAFVIKENSRTVIKVLGGHSAIRRYLGPGPEFPLQDTREARLMLAEIVAGEATRMLIERKFPKIGDLDGPAFYSEQRTYMNRYLGRCHKMLVPEASPGAV